MDKLSAIVSQLTGLAMSLIVLGVALALCSEALCHSSRQMYSVTCSDWSLISVMQGLVGLLVAGYLMNAAD